MLFVKEGWVGPYLTHIIPGVHSCQIIIARGEKWGKNYTHTYTTRIHKMKEKYRRHRQNWSVHDVHSKKKNLNADNHLYTYTGWHPYTYIVLSILYRKLCPVNLRFLNANVRNRQHVKAYNM